MKRRVSFTTRFVLLLVGCLFVFAQTAPATEITSFQGQEVMVTSDVSGSHTTTPGVSAFGLDHDGVALMRITFPAGTIRCSGSLLTDGGRTWALTAAHCSNGAISATMEFDTPTGTVIATATGASKFNVHPSYNGDTFSGYDLALIELDAAVTPSITSYELNRTVDEIGEQIVVAGYGNTGHGSTGQIGGTAGTKRVGLNRYEYQGVGGLSGGAGIFNNHTMLTYDFDSGLAANDVFNLNYGFAPDLGFGDDEAGLAPGDSGGPSFINDGGEMKIAGVHSHGFLIAGHQGDYGGGLNFGWGELQGDARIKEDSILSWIDSVIPADFSANASFDNVTDTDVLNLDFGNVLVGSSVSPLGVDLTNLDNAGAGLTARLELLSVTGSGDTGALTTDVAPFTDLAAGGTNNFEAMLDSSALGPFSASYDIDFTDSLGTNQTLTLNLNGFVENVDDAAKPDFVYNTTTGEVWIDPTDSGTLIGYHLQTPGAFLPANHTTVLAGVATSLSTELSEAALSPITAPASIGNVLAPGLTLNQVSALLTANDASIGLGVPLVGFDLDIACGAGDADCDGDVDISGDILVAFTNFTGPGTTQMLRVQGDVHGHAAGFGDDDVDVDDILQMFSSFTGPLDESGLGNSLGLLGAAEAGDPAIPDLIYDSTTGEVILDPDGSAIIGYSLKSAGAFLAGGHTPILGGVATSLSTELAEAALSSPGSAMSIGFVFPVGLDLAGLLALLTDNTVSTGLGAPLVPFDLVVVGLAVPEPSTFVCSAFGLVGMLMWMRRRRR